MVTSPSSATSVVLDASAVIRALVAEEPQANAWLDRVASRELAPKCPPHFHVEIAHALTRLVRAGALERARADATFSGVRAMRVVVDLSTALDLAIAVALDRRLSVYDAAYVVLAEALDVPLVTADQRLANATEQGVLLPG